jgi:hypothetical protein
MKTNMRGFSEKSIFIPEQGREREMEWRESAKNLIEL